MMKTFLSLSWILAAAVMVQPAAADDVTDALNEALKLYEEGKFSEASTSVQIAMSGIAEKKSGAIVAALPDTIGEWTGGEVETTNMAMLGGGSNVERPYTKGDRSARLSIMADSAMLGQIVGMMANPALAGLTGMKLKKVGDATISIQPKEGMGQMAIDNRFLIQIQGDELTEEEILAFAAGVKVDALKELK